MRSKPTYRRTSTEGLYSPTLIEEIMDEDRDNYKRQLKFWWESLTKEEQTNELENDEQLKLWI